MILAESCELLKLPPSVLAGSYYCCRIRWMNQPIQGLSASLVVVIVPSLSPRDVLAFVEAHFLSPDSRARPDLKTKNGGFCAISRQVNTCWGPLGQRQWKVMESSLWSAHPDMNPRLQPLLLSKNILKSKVSRDVKCKSYLRIRLDDMETCSSPRCQRPPLQCHQTDPKLFHLMCAQSTGPHLKIHIVKL